MSVKPASEKRRSGLDLAHWLDQRFPYLLIAPALIILLVVLAYPLGYSLWLSVHEWTLQEFRKAIPFVGLDNYARLLSNADFWRSVRTTGLLTIGALTSELILGMVLALLLHTITHASRFFRSVVLLPMMVTNVVIGLVFRMMFNFDAGVLNWFLGVLGMNPSMWVSAVNTALPSLILVDVWNTTSFVTLILLAGLQSLPEEPLEAAKIDGATRIQLFRHIVLPLLRPAILVAIVWRFIDLVRIFDVVYSLTGGGPAAATEVISIYAYRNGFQRFDLGYASAMSWLMIVVMLGVAFILFRAINRTEQIY